MKTIINNIIPILAKNKLFRKFTLLLINTCILVVFLLVLFLNPWIKSKQNSSELIISEKSDSTSSTNIEEVPTKLLFLGDTMLSRTIGTDINEGKDPFLYVRKIFELFDVVIANLETTISHTGIGTPQSGKLYTFNASLSVLPVLKSAGISMVTVANNHTMDFGNLAFSDTLKNLEEHGIKYVGGGEDNSQAFKPYFLTFQDLTVALIAVNDIETVYTAATENSPGSAYFDKERIKRSLQDAGKSADIIIILPHWGIEYQLYPNNRQIEWAHYFIDNGADLVIGAHPHVIQTEEVYKDRKIYYSVGNFVFDGMPYIENANKGQIVEVKIYPRKKIESKTLNITLNLEGYPILSD